VQRPGVPQVPEVPADEGRRLVDEGALLLDVREPMEWQAGHAPAAVHLPLGTLPHEVHQLPPGGRVVVVCRSGSRSASATRWLNAQGFDAVNLAGGMQAWAQAGLPVVDDRGAPGRVA
jgi:rhodanese-related sulfurtransferase